MRSKGWLATFLRGTPDKMNEQVAKMLNTSVAFAFGPNSVVWEEDGGILREMTTMKTKRQPKVACRPSSGLRLARRPEGKPITKHKIHINELTPRNEQLLAMILESTEKSNPQSFGASTTMHQKLTSYQQASIRHRVLRDRETYARTWPIATNRTHWQRVG